MFFIALILGVLSLGVGYVTLSHVSTTSTIGSNKGSNISATLSSATATPTSLTPDPTATSTSATPNPVATDTPSAPSYTSLPTNKKNPKLPLNLNCVRCQGTISIVLKSIGYDAGTGTYMWAFSIINHVGVNCSQVYFQGLHLALPDGTMDQPTNSIGQWPMGINQTVEEDAFFSGFQPNTRYTLHVDISHCNLHEHNCTKNDADDHYATESNRDLG